MATLLDTTGGSYHLEQIIKGATERLALRANERIREFLVSGPLTKCLLRRSHNRHQTLRYTKFSIRPDAPISQNFGDRIDLLQD